MAGPKLVQEVFKFLIHFMGDMHQLLHLSGRDRGGNSDKVIGLDMSQVRLLVFFHF